MHDRPVAGFGAGGPADAAEQALRGAPDPVPRQERGCASGAGHRTGYAIARGLLASMTVNSPGMR
ncbi:hypothetical protein GCM10027400_12270 [Pseudoxanthomonas daejeonensis]